MHERPPEVDTGSSRPALVLVGGVPGSGKSTLAARLGDALPAPAMLKDAIKEGISLTEGVRGSYGGPIAQRSFAALYGCISVLLANRCTVVAEAAFRRDWFEHEIAPFTKQAEVRLVVCSVSQEIAASRYAARAASGDPRRAAHPDALIIEAMAAGHFDWGAYNLADSALPTLIVNTESDYQPRFDEVLAFARGQ
jgi:hypothetical protein